MYLEVYNAKKQHITNIVNLTYTITQKATDFDNISFKGAFMDSTTALSKLNSESLFGILCEDNGKRTYAFLIKSILVDNNVADITGLDLRTLYNNDIYLDFTELTTEIKLKKLLTKVFTAVKEINNTFEFEDLILEVQDEDTTVIMDYTQEDAEKHVYQNAWDFQKVYLNYFSCYLKLELTNDFKIRTTITQNAKEKVIKLKDFIISRTTTAISTNKCVGYLLDQDTNQQLKTVVYYLGKDNNIYEDVPAEKNIMIPVKVKIFTNTSLSQLRLDCVSELANNRYVESIVITDENVYNPIDLSILNLYDKIKLYDDNGFYKVLPVTEKENKNGNKKTIKLGFKKLLLTDILKGGKVND